MSRGSTQGSGRAPPGPGGAVRCGVCVWVLGVAVREVAVISWSTMACSVSPASVRVTRRAVGPASPGLWCPVFDPGGGAAVVESGGAGSWRTCHSGDWVWGGVAGGRGLCSGVVGCRCVGAGVGIGIGVGVVGRWRWWRLGRWGSVAGWRGVAYYHGPSVRGVAYYGDGCGGGRIGNRTAEPVVWKRVGRDDSGEARWVAGVGHHDDDTGDRCSH